MILRRGGIYLARLDPVMGAEVGKLRPVVVLMDQMLLDVEPPHVFICPLSSRSDPAYAPLHVPLEPRGDLEVVSYALVEHCRSISIRRLRTDRIGQIDEDEIAAIIHRLTRLVGL